VSSVQRHFRTRYGKNPPTRNLSTTDTSVGRAGLAARTEEWAQNCSLKTWS
jgi:hypothetical protein